MSPLNGRLAMLGAGSMGRAILQGLLAAGVGTDQLVATGRNPERLAQLAADLGIEVTDDNAAAVRDADVVVIAVKPKDVLALVEGLSFQEGTLLVSVAAGISAAALEAAAPTAHVVRVMPNTPARVGQGMSGISGGASATDEDVERAARLMSAVGRAVVVPENQQDLVVAACGSGVAYLFLVAEAMIESGVTLGLTRAQAAEMVTQTFTGASAMLATGEHPAMLREAVTSPGGTTAAALRTLEAHGVRTAFHEAMTAARDASAALGG